MKGVVELSSLAIGMEPESSRPQGSADAPWRGRSAESWREEEALLAARQDPPPALPPAPALLARWYAVSVFCVTGCLLFADQNLMAPNLSAIAADLGLSHEQRDRYLGGYVAAAFYMVGAPAALAFGALSDRVSRRRLLFWAVMLGEAPCALTYFVTRYWQLLLLRVLTGISLGGAFPLIFSLVADLFPPARRAAVAALVQLSVGLGLALGQGLAGLAGPALGWRWPFVLVALPCAGAAGVMLATTREPARGSHEAGLAAAWALDPEFRYSERMSWRKAARLVRTPTNALLCLQGLFGCVPWGMLLTFLNDYLSQDRGLSVRRATGVILGLGAGGALGVVAGGAAGQWLYNRVPWTASVFVAVCTAAGTLPMWYVINVHPAPQHVAGLHVAAFFAGVGSSVVGPSMRAMLLNVNEPEARGVALALQTMLDDLGKGLGPALVAVLISHVGRRQAFNWATAAWLPCALCLLGTAVTLAPDERAMQRRLERVIADLRRARAEGGPGETAPGTGPPAQGDGYASLPARDKVRAPAVVAPLEPLPWEDEDPTEIAVGARLLPAGAASHLAPGPGAAASGAASAPAPAPAPRRALGEVERGSAGSPGES